MKDGLEVFILREDMKILIAEAFIDLLEKESIDKITVKQLIEECHISRQTFYYHFRDIMDVLEWAFRRSALKAAEQSLQAENHLDALRVFVNFVKTHKNKLDRLLNSKNWIQIEAILVESVAMYLGKMARSKFADIEISYDDMEIMLQFYASGIVGVLIHYSRQNQLDEEKIIRQIEKIITGKIYPAQHS